MASNCSLELFMLLLLSVFTSAHTTHKLPEHRNFWHASCSARGVYIDGSAIATLFFYASLLGVCVALTALAYNACFRLFTRSVLRSTW
ncbi:membrane protein [Cercopithecine alphaherpesvirus 9]|uniref:Membrane protein n=1 Tax=Cercopithecine herpesvirus 9 (strain DHV) TaxID=36348 RepID=Q9E207_CHV9D|nr:envelope glycoprotein N [Cercopithecine alphaherpesvirus 9]AAG27247.1 membrane protein [Cercopithecine alphaherpesvirus 9]